MKILTTLCLLLIAIHVRADIVISEIIEVGGQTQNLTTKVKGDKIRTDVSDQMSTITDTASGDFITLLHAQKSYVRMSASKTKALMDQMRALQGATPAASPAEKPKFVDAGKGEKVNDYETEMFTVDMPTGKITFWVAKDFPNAAAVQQAYRKIQTSMESKLGSSNGGQAPDITQLPGLPVKTVIEKGGQTMTKTLVSVKEQPVDDADLTIPADYKEMQMPSMNGGDGAPKP